MRKTCCTFGGGGSVNHDAYLGRYQCYASLHFQLRTVKELYRDDLSKVNITF